MSALPHPQSARLDFRVSPEHKSLIERAARVQGQTVSSFAIATLLKAAEETIQSETSRTLSARDSLAFLAMLTAPAGPNAALKAAAKRYKARRGR
ncbi:MAG: type II toxin-antitoxin system TacA family antitoxin [Phycisphaerales bacterium]